MFSDRLKYIRKKLNMTQAQVSRFFGVTQQAVAKWEAALSFPEPDTIARLARYFKVSADYLLGLSDNPHPPGEFAQVKIIGEVKAGYNLLAYEEDLSTAPASVDNAELYRFLTVRGDSMEPFIRDGDLALVKLQQTLYNGDLGVVIYGEDSEATLKKYYYENGVVILMPYNKNYETMVIKGRDLDELYIFGKVIETITKW